MPRLSWSGAISFGMVSIPIKLVPAVRRRTISFNQFDRESMSRVRYRKVAEATGEEVQPDQIIKGADLGGENYVIVEDDELAALAPERSSELSIEAFVDAGEIDPLAFDSSYYVVPSSSAKPYLLLAKALDGTGKVGIGRFVMRQKEHLALIRSDGNRLLLSTIVFPDEIVDAGEITEFDEMDGVEVAEAELEMAGSLVEAMSADFAAGDDVDEHRVAVEKLIEEKAAGRAPTAASAPAVSAQVIDLADALEASLREAQKAKKRHPASRAKKAAGTKKRAAVKTPANRASAGKAAAKSTSKRARKSA